MFQVYIIEYYLFSDFKNYDNMLEAKIISNLSHLFEAMNVDAVLVSWCTSSIKVLDKICSYGPFYLLVSFYVH